jgi:ribosomal-protein-alanine N-acetyltransferase
LRQNPIEGERQVEIRSWKKEDVDSIAQMEERCFSDAWSKQSLLSAFEDAFTHCFLIEEGGQVCAYACLFVIFEQAEVQNIAVDIPFRRKGFGDKLLAFLHDFAKEKGAQTCFLEVRKSNFSAISLYEKHGYQAFGKREKYYQDGEDCILMQKQL